MAKILEYEKKTAFEDSDVLITDGNSGTKTITVNEAAKDLIERSGIKEDISAIEGEIDDLTLKIDSEVTKQIGDLQEKVDDSLSEHIKKSEARLASLETFKTNTNTRLGVIQQTANDASDYAGGAYEKIEEIETALESVESSLRLKIDGMDVDDEGLVYLLSNGERVAGPFGPFAGGGSGGGTSGNNAVMTARNASGWSSKTVAQNADCFFTLNWTSIESEMATGNGTCKITVNGATAANLDVSQGDVEINLAGYLQTGSNSVRIQIQDIYGNVRNMVISVKVVALTLTSTFDNTSAFDDVIPFTYIPTGAVEKTVHILLDGVEVNTITVSTSGRQQTYYIPAQDHGSHSLEAYFTAEIDGTTIESNHLYYDLICLKAGNFDPVIGVEFNSKRVDQYSNLTIPYTVYNPDGLTSDISLKVNGRELTTLTVDRTRQIWTYRADIPGDLVLSITCGPTTKNIPIEVKGVSVNVAAETENLELHLSSYGRSNSEETPGVWKSGSIEAQFSNFNFVSDGWVTDNEGITVLRLSDDARLTIPFNIFANDFRSTGKTLEFEFATRNVRDYDAKIISCMSGNRGIEFTAQQAVLKSAQSTISMSYKDDEHLRVAFVVEKRNKNNLIYVYVDGNMSGAIIYPDADDFSQINPVGISVGSNDCGVDLYCIRVYDNDLTKEQVVNNWIADTQNGIQMLQRYSHNNVYDEYGQIVIEKLPKDLPYLILEGPELPQSKGDKKTVSGQYVDPVTASRSFTFTNAQIDVQGTSSQYYARKNYKLSLKNGLDTNQGHQDTYALRVGAIPVNVFCFKADVASSEGCNNVELARLYNDTCPFKTAPQKANNKVRQGIDGFPIVVFWNDGEKTTFLGKYNFNNDKSTEETFGFSSGDESWETLNNTSDLALFKSSEMTTLDGNGKPVWETVFEGRYPDKNKDIEKLSQFITWVKSTDGNKPKFKSEASNWFDVDDACFYWLFTEIFLMVDSRAKNTFPTRYDADGKWCWLPYDFDTALGINNEGSLVFGYSYEDTDHLEGGEDVFNGQTSVFWNNLRDCFSDRIATMYQELRSTGAISYQKVIKMFEDHQAVWSEAIFNEDAQYKYLDPLIYENKPEYISMLQGSKKSHREWWLYNRMRYMDSKYNAGDDRTDTITLRGYAKSDITVVPYADIYTNIKYGSALVSKRAERNKSYLLPCPLDNVNDTEIYIYSASRIASVGDLSGLKVGYADFSNAVKLSELKLGDSAANYRNANLTELHLGNNVLLKKIDCRNCTSLGTGTMASVDVSGCSSIEELYFDNTKITGLSMPNGGLIKKIHLPATITNLTIRNQKQIEELSIASYSNISTLWLENTNLDVDDLVSKIPDSTRVRIIGIDKNFDTVEEINTYLDKFDRFRGIDELGNNTETAQISGVIHIDSIRGSEAAVIKERYPYIVIDAPRLECNVYYYNDTGTTLLHTETVYGSGDATYSVKPTKTNTAQYRYEFTGWSKSANGPAWTGAQKKVTEDRKLYASYKATVRTYTVYFYNGTELLYTVNNVPYGTTVEYKGSIPESGLVDPDGSGIPFQRWSPALSPIVSNISYLANFDLPYEDAEIEDDWETILANIDNGTYREKYKIGNYKKMAFSTKPDNPVSMQIVAFDRDEQEDGSRAPTTWISKELPTYFKSQWNPSPVCIYTVQDIEAGWTQTSTVTVQSQNRNVENVHATGVLTITATEAGTITLKARIAGNATTNCGSFTVKIDNEIWLEDSDGDAGFITKEIEASSGQIITVELDYLNKMASLLTWAELTMEGKYTFTVTSGPSKKGVETGGEEGTGTFGGWEKSQIRRYCKETVLPTIPEMLRSRILTVKKTQLTHGSGRFDLIPQTTYDNIWIPAGSEYEDFYKTFYKNISTNMPDLGYQYYPLRKENIISGNAEPWWQRTCDTDNSPGIVIANGGLWKASPTTACSFPICFCL